jgi:hypothetical protein
MFFGGTSLIIMVGNVAIDTATNQIHVPVEISITDGLMKSVIEKTVANLWQTNQQIRTS